MKRMAMVIGLKPEKVTEYKELHANAWPEVLDQISKCGIRNYSIYLKEPENLLFGYWEYHGDNFAADAARMATHPKTQEWWALTDPCQTPLQNVAEGEMWAMMEEVFHHD
ncbi:L-rhamnose mutarotase [Aliiroseovarius subalbicans]|uniref:L-rhamnose mutarotase n=1 Tax=Aliiroseovarius subalbicans TaxID=2925840 RepID=UPI001F58C5B0|nr:L-rhamnose mutarotase [Aliiroseovarius subalbicans]MCI2400913.1 L-rhamnose mutarotase [Aliiroseovarius subalbicans]